MSSTAITVIGSAILALLLAGYLAPTYLPPPKPRVVGIDLGTTFSCVGVYEAVSGNVSILENKQRQRCIASIVGFGENVTLVGDEAQTSALIKPHNIIYDAKRFIGKTFTTAEIKQESARYPFKISLDETGGVRFVIGSPGNTSYVTPEQVGSAIISKLRGTAERNLSRPVTRAVLSVPAEFDQAQRNATRRAAVLAGLDVLRIINEPTAAALAYGLHKKQGVHYVLVVDLGGGTLDVSLLNIQGGMFLTQAMAGNNHLGGQDFNRRVLLHLLQMINHQADLDEQDLQMLRNAVERGKLHLTQHKETMINLHLQSINQKFTYTLTRETFNAVNEDLFLKVLQPIKSVLQDVEMTADDIDEIVLVGGSTRVPRVRQIIGEMFGRSLNTAVDPELAVATGVAIQAGILGGMWPLKVSATELPSHARKIHVY